ncbi:DDE-type integrase/transposase/recombinase [Bacillus thuringiensis]|uniref:DDE-type integrase/transposase/recombinase n=1 Tax=Bacillus thuringiensis TaxID=1428 RepID=UPI003B98206B
MLPFEYIFFFHTGHTPFLSSSTSIVQFERILSNRLDFLHQNLKKRVRSMLGFKSFGTAPCILAGVEAMHMIKKEQVDLRDQSVQNQKEFIHQLFGLTA